MVDFVFSKLIEWDESSIFGVNRKENGVIFSKAGIFF